MAENSLPGTGMNPELVANSILVRAFRDNIPVSPMKLQKLLFFVTCLYQRNTSVRLLTESFQPWKYGPVVRSVHDEFKGFGGSPITSYARDAQGNAYAANEDSNPPLKQALDEIWSHMKNYTAVQLSRITHIPGSAWSKANAENKWFVGSCDMADDHTFDPYLAI